MKVAILGDIHGNADALAAVLEAARREKVERILNTGDLVGYYHQPKAVLDHLALWACVSVLGNHDEMLARAEADPGVLSDITARYGSGLACALRDLARDELVRVTAAPRVLRLALHHMHIVLAHGAPWDTDCYVYPDADDALLDKVVASAGPAADLVVLGHTHHQCLWSRGPVRILNPGSVGQPRDRKPGAAWALLDTSTGSIDLRREGYETATVIRDAQRLDPDLPYLWRVLGRT